MDSIQASHDAFRTWLKGPWLGEFWKTISLHNDRVIIHWEYMKINKRRSPTASIGIRSRTPLFLMGIAVFLIDERAFRLTHRTTIVSSPARDSSCIFTIQCYLSIQDSPNRWRSQESIVTTLSPFTRMGNKVSQIEGSHDDLFLISMDFWLLAWCLCHSLSPCRTWFEMVDVEDDRQNQRVNPRCL